MNDDKFLDYYVVVEQTSPEGIQHNIIEEKMKADGTLSFLRFRACLQSFKARNRNGRLWVSKSVKDGLKARHIAELLRKGFPGESGHPIGDIAKTTIERIRTIDPNNLSHKFNKFEWSSDDTLLYAEVETLDDIVGPGARFARHIMQGLEPAFSLRSIVPQRKNKDGTIDVIGTAFIITYDRVILPSHEEAYRDISIPVKQITTKPVFESMLDEAAIYCFDKSEKTKAIATDFEPVMESASMDPYGFLTLNTKKEGRIIIPVESDIKNEIKNYMKNLK
jgi:hypothetical protein